MGQLEHAANKKLWKAEKQYKRWGGKSEADSVIRAMKDVQKAKDDERESEDIRNWLSDSSPYR